MIYQETNPYASLTAYLEDDGRTVYLYLQSEFNPEWKIRALWIKNRIEAPTSRSKEDFSSGKAPILCKDELTSDSNTDEIHSEDVHFIWTEEGDGVALFIKEELFAFLPPWSGINSILGYSKFARIDTIVANPLGSSSHGILAERVEASRKFWEHRAHHTTWKNIQSKRLDFLESKLGKHTKYWSADGGKFPLVGIAKFEPVEFPDTVVYSTIGMSAQNMPTVELYHKDYENYARVEIIFAIKKLEPDKSETWIPHFYGELIRFPWGMVKWLGHGHTISITRKDPDSLYLNFNSAVLKNLNHSDKKNHPDLTGLLSESNSEIQFLAILPVSDEEAYWIHSEGSQKFFGQAEIKNIYWVHESERESIL
jgi:hypothetical protein